MILLAPPSMRALKRAIRASQDEPFRWAYLGTSVLRLRSAEACLGGRATRLVIAKDVQSAAQSLRGAYIHYIGQLGLHRSSDLWWYSTLSEKNPAISKVFLHVCYVAVAAELCRRHQGGSALLLIVENASVRVAIARYLAESGAPFVEISEPLVVRVAGVLREWAEMILRRVLGVSRHVIRMVTARLMGFSDGVKGGATEKADARVLLYNWVDDRSFDQNGRYTDVYFGPLREELQKRGILMVVVATVLYRMPYRRILAWLRQSGIPVFVPEATFTPGILWRWFRSLPVRPPEPRCWPRLERFDVSAILDETERLDWITTRAADVRLISDMVNQWSCHITVRSFIYPYEGQSWERGYCRALRERHPQACLIGYQHATVSPMWLSHFIAPAEWGQVPFPDRVVTSGRYPYELLRSNGIPDSALVCGSSLRYSLTLEANGSVRNLSPAGPSVVRVLVAPSIMMTQAAELLLAALKAFADPAVFRVMLKPHPCFPAARVLDAAGVATLPSHVTIVKDPVPVLLENADALVYTDSTTAVESIALGVPIVHFASNHEIDTDPLAMFDRVRVSVDSPERMQEAVRLLATVGADERAARAHRWQDVVSLLLPPTDEKIVDLFLPNGGRRGMASTSRETADIH